MDFVYGSCTNIVFVSVSALFAVLILQVGDIRAGRTTILDTYLLKSLDVFDFDALRDGLPGCLRLTLEIKDLATSVNHCESSRSEVAGSWAAALYLFGRVDTWQDHRVVILPCKGNRRCIWVATDDTCNDERCRSLRRQPLHLSPSYRVRVSWRVCQTESH